MKTANPLRRDRRGWSLPGWRGRRAPILGPIGSGGAKRLMKDLVFLDSSVLLYAANANPGEREKHRTAVALIEGGPFAISGQVLAEFYSIATSAKGRLTADQAHAWNEKLSAAPCVAIDSSLVLAGVAHSRRYRISYWDGAIVAAAEKAGADILFTEDLSDGQKYGAVEARNPFASQGR